MKQELHTWEGWHLNRERPPLALLGERHGVRLGVRQLERPVTFELETVQGLVIPTAEETLRIKAYLCIARQATRDFLDVAALADKLGDARALEALRFLNVLYPGSGNQSCITRLAEVTTAGPLDLEHMDLETFRGLEPRYRDWAYVSARCQDLARQLLLLEMEGEVATRIEEFLASAEVRDLRAPGGQTPPGAGTDGS